MVFYTDCSNLHLLVSGVKHNSDCEGKRMGGVPDTLKKIQLIIIVNFATYFLTDKLKIN